MHLYTSISPMAGENIQQNSHGRYIQYQIILVYDIPIACTISQCYYKWEAIRKRGVRTNATTYIYLAFPCTVQYQISLMQHMYICGLIKLCPIIQTSHTTLWWSWIIPWRHCTDIAPTAHGTWHGTRHTAHGTWHMAQTLSHAGATCTIFTYHVALAFLSYLLNFILPLSLAV